jgi:hypothetical protein
MPGAAATSGICGFPSTAGEQTVGPVSWDAAPDGTELFSQLCLVGPFSACEDVF